MESKIIELLSEEIRETRNMTMAIKEETRETRNMTLAIKEDTTELRKLVQAAERKAEAAWELVIMTREEMKRPFWKKWFN